MSQGLADVSATLRRCHVLTNNAVDGDIFGFGSCGRVNLYAVPVVYVWTLYDMRGSFS